MNAPDQPVSLLRGRLPPGVDLRLIVIDPGETRPFDPDDLCDALVVIEQGEVDVSSRRFVAGDVLAFDRIARPTLTNPGTEPALVAVAKRVRPGPS